MPPFNSIRQVHLGQTTPRVEGALRPPLLNDTVMFTKKTTAN